MLLTDDLVLHLVEWRQKGMSKQDQILLEVFSDYISPIITGHIERLKQAWCRT